MSIKRVKVKKILKKSKSITVLELYKMQIAQKPNVRPNTVQMRRYIIERLKKDILGGLDITCLNINDVKEWLKRCKNEGLSFGSIKNHKRSLSAAFQMAVQNDYITKNPFNFDIRDVLENDTKSSVPLSAKQQKKLMDFLKADAVYSKSYDEVIIFLGTGLRASELCGLTKADVDFTKRTIKITHQLLKNSQTGFYIVPPKTKSSYRTLYMTDLVYGAMKRIYERSKDKCCLELNGYKDFLFLNKNSEPMTVAAYDAMFRRFLKKYRKTNSYPMPQSVTPHTLRHTFCTNMANAGMNPKSLQYIMGHSSINLTMNYYSHASFENAKKEMKRIVS